MSSTLKHIAFIMDGNRRWAKQNKFSFFMGHRSGARNIEPLVDFAMEKGITHLTFWAFSTENWKRSQEELDSLMDVFRESLSDPMIIRLQENKVKINIIGDVKKFPDDIQKQVATIIQNTKDNNKMTVNIALNYGGRDEIITAVNKLLSENRKNITEDEFSEFLFTKGQPDPDMIVRTGGEIRLSGYLPWQSIYSELYFTNVLWPNFDINEFEKALLEFESRQRRFGT